jgi:hypothetical protein
MYVCLCVCVCVFERESVYVYICIYMRVCVCVYVCERKERKTQKTNFLLIMGFLFLTLKNIVILILSRDYKF